MTETIADALHTKLSNMNIKFEECALVLAGLTNEEQNVKNTMKNIEMSKTNEVLSAKHVETGKSKYKNQTERDIAVQKSMSADEIYMESKERSRKIMQEIKNKTAVIDILKFQQRGVITQLNYQIELLKVKE